MKGAAERGTFSAPFRTFRTPPAPGSEGGWTLSPCPGCARHRHNKQDTVKYICGPKPTNRNRPTDYMGIAIPGNMDKHGLSLGGAGA